MAPSVFVVFKIPGETTIRKENPPRQFFPPLRRINAYIHLRVYGRGDGIDRQRKREERGGKIGRVVEAGMSRRRRRTHIHQGGPQADHYCGLSAVIEFKHQRRYYLTN